MTCHHNAEDRNNRLGARQIPCAIRKYSSRCAAINHVVLFRGQLDRSRDFSRAGRCTGRVIENTERIADRSDRKSIGWGVRIERIGGTLRALFTESIKVATGT